MNKLIMSRTCPKASFFQENKTLPSKLARRTRSRKWWKKVQVMMKKKKRKAKKKTTMSEASRRPSPHLFVLNDKGGEISIKA